MMNHAQCLLLNDATITTSGALPIKYPIAKRVFKNTPFLANSQIITKIRNTTEDAVVEEIEIGFCLHRACIG